MELASLSIKMTQKLLGGCEAYGWATYFACKIKRITGDSLYFKNIWLQRSDDTAFTAFSVTSGGALEIGNLGSLYIGGIGGTVAWRTVELVTGGTALALCQV